MGTIPIECLVDTGAALSLLHGDVWTKIATSGTPPLQEWIGQALALVNGNKLSVRGYTRIPVSLKGKQFDVKFIVADDIMVDAILGLDFVQQNHCIIDCGRKLITFRSKEFSLPRDDGSRHNCPRTIGLVIQSAKNCTGWKRDGDNGNTIREDCGG